MRKHVAIVYNEPEPSRYDNRGEVKAVLGVLDSVQAVEQALLELGYSVTLLPLAYPFEQAREKLNYLNVDLVFNLFEGFAGYPETEALMPEALAALGVPYTGCRDDILRLSLDKARIKIFLQGAGIPTPDAQLLTPQTLAFFRLGFPCIVKPCGEDASHGITGDSGVNDLASLAKQVRVVSDAYGGSALIEKFIDGREYNATVMGNTRYAVLPISEMVYALPPELPRVLTFEAKWEPDSPYFKGTSAICPADIVVEEQTRIAGTALSVFRLLGCQGYARVDMRADREGRMNVIEVNPNPDISPGNGAARQAAAAGMAYVGELYAKSEYYVTELLLCSDAMNAGVSILKPHIKGDEAKKELTGRIVVGVVQGDIHDIGKNLVATMFDAAGWTVHDLGKDVPHEKIVDEAVKCGADVVGMSSLMTTAMLGMPRVIKMLRKVRPDIIVMIGGAPINPDVAKLYEADGYAPNAGTAVKVASELLKQRVASAGR